jgi:hypothetical protein
MLAQVQKQNNVGAVKPEIFSIPLTTKTHTYEKDSVIVRRGGGDKETKSGMYLCHVEYAKCPIRHIRILAYQLGPPSPN